jgi:hypothetical protein
MSATNRKPRIAGCCSDFTKRINNKCEEHGFDCPDNVIRLYIGPKSGVDFGIQHPDGISYYKIKFCPWCGASLAPILKEAIEK